MNITSDNVKSFLMLAAVGFVGFKIYQAKQLAGDAVDIAKTKLNPASKENFIYSNIRPGGMSLGSWLYKVTH